MELRYCPHCEQDKEFDPAQKRDSKARGFKGTFCWDCYQKVHNAQHRAMRGAEAGKIKNREASKRSRAAAKGAKS